MRDTWNLGRVYYAFDKDTYLYQVEEDRMYALQKHRHGHMDLQMLDLRLCIMLDYNDFVMKSFLGFSLLDVCILKIMQS